MNDILQKVDLMKKEIDALQIAVTGQRKPWYKQVSTILAIVALLFSFGTTYVSYHRTSIQDIQNTRQELRSLLQRLAALPKENVDIQKKYVEDPASMQLVSGFINQENTLIARQAAELAKKLPSSLVTATEFHAIAVALQSAYDLVGANEFLKYAINASKDFNSEIAALRMAANLKFIQGRPEAGRIEYQKALAIFSKYPNFDTFTMADTNVLTELSWAYSEANAGLMELASQHVNNAKKVLIGLQPSPGYEMLSSRISQAEQRLSTGFNDNKYSGK